MNEIKIITELCAEDRARLDRIAGLLEADIEAKLRTPKTTAETPQKSTEPEPQKAEPVSVETEEQKPEKVDVSVEDIRRLVVTLSASGKKDKAREVIQTYARTVSDLPADKYAEVWAKLKALEV